MKKIDPAKIWSSAVSRRRFVKDAGLSVAAIAAGLSSAPARTQDLPKVAEDDPTAKSLNYVHDATTVDAAKRQSDRFCNNCALYQGGADDEWAGCSIFPGKLVKGSGWCSVWAPRQS